MFARWLRATHSPAYVLASALVFSMVLALAANATLEIFQLGIGEPPRTTRGDQVRLFAFGTGLVWLFVVFVLAITGRLWLTTALVALVTLGFGYANRVKLKLRLEPIYPSDLWMAREVDFLAAMVGYRVLAYGVAVGIVLLGLGLAGGHVAGKLFPRIRLRDQPRLAVGVILVRLCLVGLLVPTFVYLSDFNAPSNSARRAYEALGATWRHWDQRANYRANGVVGGFLYNTDVPGMDPPKGYSREVMQRLAKRYAEVAARTNRRRDSDALSEVNLVMVLSETFTDPLRLSSVQVAEDPIPYTRSLIRRTTSGSMLASKFGGGTANMEFSALTGMTLGLFQPQLTTPYQMLVPEYSEFPSFVRYVESEGQRSVAIHPYLPSLYRRSEVYPILGFDQAVFAAQMRHQDTIEDNEFISDEAAFQEVNDHIASSSGPLFVNLVTMQNHFPMAGNYADPIPVTGLRDAKAAADAKHYVRGLRYTDEALQKFIQSLHRSEERTVVLFYGDHLPAFWPSEVRRANGPRVVRETPFFVYANFGEQRARRLPTTSPMYFGNLLLSRAGAPVTPFHAMLGKVRRLLPAVEPPILIDHTNRRVAPAELSSRARRMLHDLRLVQYDLSVGEGYVADELYTVPPPSAP